MSTAREEMISPELQRATIEHYCEQRGYVLVDVIEDLDQTGRNFARAGVQQAVESVERGEAEVIVVWKVSRFGRTRRDWYVHADRVEVAGGSLESASEGFDASTPQGRFTRGMFVEMAALESDLIGETWRDVHTHRLSQGLPHAGGPRFGYRYDRETGYSIDPVTGPVLAECYRRYVGGEAPRLICEWLTASGIRTTTGGQWRASGLREYLSRGFGAGFIYSHGELRPGAHEPVISEQTWAAYQSRRATRGRTPARTLAGSYPLSGLVVCATCGRRMQVWNGFVGTKKDRPQSAYRCPPEGCGRCYVATSVLHAEVKAWLAAEVADDLNRRAEVKARSTAKQAVARADVHAVAAEVREIEKAIDRLTDGYSRGIIPERTYRNTLDDLTQQREGLDARAVELAADVRATRRSARPVARSLVRDYDVILERDPAGLGEILRLLVAGILVQPGDHRHLRERKARVVARWT